MKQISAIIMLMALGLWASAQDSTYARRIIGQLTSPEFFGRGHEHHGDSIAAEYLRSEMKAIGLKPLADDYFQHYSYSTYILEKDVRLTINKQQLVPYQDFRVTYTNRIKDFENKRHYPIKNGGVVVGVDKLDTYSPLSTVWRAGTSRHTIAIEVLNSKLPKRVRKIDADLNLDVRLQYKTQNVMGYLLGESDSIIVFCGHYDHCGMMGNEVFFPGAHDNASGCAAVLDIARHLANQGQKPKYTMVFMLFSGEESGLKGSKYAASHQVIDFSKVKLLCNIDMFCGGDEGIQVFNATGENTKEYYQRLVAINNEKHLVAEIRPKDNRPNSDHYPFSAYCPAMFIHTLGGPYGGYHDPADKCESCGLGHYNDIVSLIMSLTK